MAAQPRSSKKSAKLGRKKSPAKTTSPGPSPRRNSSPQRSKPAARKVVKTAQGKKISAKSTPKSSEKMSRGPQPNSPSVASRKTSSSAKSTAPKSTSSATRKKLLSLTPSTSPRKASPDKAAASKATLKSKVLPKLEKATSTENATAKVMTAPPPTTHSRKKSSKKVSGKKISSKKSSATPASHKKVSAKSSSKQPATSTLPASQKTSSTSASKRPPQTQKTVSEKKTAKKPEPKAVSTKTTVQINPLVHDIRSALEQYRNLKDSSERFVSRLRQLKDANQIPELFKLFASEEDPFGLRSSIILTLEAFSEEDYYAGLVGALPQLAKHCPAWGFVMLLRLVNTRGYQDDAWKRFVATLTQHPPRIRKIVQTVLEEHREQTSSDTSNMIRLALADLSATS